MVSSAFCAALPYWPLVQMKTLQRLRDCIIFDAKISATVLPGQGFGTLKASAHWRGWPLRRSVVSV